MDNYTIFFRKSQAFRLALKEKVLVRLLSLCKEKIQPLLRLDFWRVRLDSSMQPVVLVGYATLPFAKQKNSFEKIERKILEG